MMTRRVLALGSFDGVHLAHKALIDAAIKLSQELCAEVAVFCFSTPPAAFVNPELKLLTTPAQKKELLQSFGVKEVILADYQDFCSIEAEPFIDDYLIGRLGAVGVVCGYNFTFGRDRLGTIPMLCNRFGDRGVRIIDPVISDGQPISSSRIRACLLRGEIESANALLGRSFYINCEVSGGRQDGRKLGFPTLNQVPHASVAIPKHGVYVTRSIFDNGEIYYSITDVGLAPTLDKSGVVRLETHLLEANPTQAPKAFTVEFLSRIRDEQHFSTANELQEQISLDVAFARSYFNL